MDRELVLEKVTEIAADVFGEDDLVLEDETTAADVEKWDSLTHLALMSELEDEFDITFTMGEVQSLKNVGELVDIIVAKVG